MKYACFSCHNHCIPLQRVSSRVETTAGCYLIAISYVARFQRRMSDERSRLVSDGVVRPFVRLWQRFGGEQGAYAVIYKTAQKFLLAAIIVFILSGAVRAQTASPKPESQPGSQASQAKLTLVEAIQKAEQNYPRIRAAAEQRLSAEASVGVARAAYLPRTDLLWQTNRATANNIYGLLLPQSVIPSISGPVLPSDPRSAWSSAGGALLSWQPFDFGYRRAQVDYARDFANAAGAGEKLTRLDIALATANAYFDLAAAQQFTAVAQANVDRLQVFAKVVGVLVKQELRPGADTAQAEADFARARTQLIRAQTEVVSRRAVLANLVGLPTAQLVLDDQHLLTNIPSETLPDGQLNLHPAAQRESALVNQQEARLNALSRSYVPQFDAQAAISGRGAGTALAGSFPGGANGLAPDTMNWALGFQVTFPAFDFFSLRSQKKAQEANVRAERHRYQETLLDLSVQVQQAQAELEGARQAAQNTPLELAAARQSETQQRARFDAGLATVVDVSAAESLLVQAEADDVVARLSVWRAYAALAAAHGDLNQFLAQLGQP